MYRDEKEKVICTCHIVACLNGRTGTEYGG